MTAMDQTVFLFDVHNTLLDNDRVIQDLRRHIWGERLTTVFPRQGHYALDRKNVAEYPAADLTLERIGELVRYDLPALLRGATAAGLINGQPGEER